MLGASAPTLSVTVLPLIPKNGVNKDVADLLTDSLVSALRKTHRFGRVVAFSELETTLQFDAQKQLASCDTASCMAEIAGTLGVDFIITGNVGRLGEVWLLNLKLIDVKTGVGEGTVSRSIDGRAEDVVLKALNGCVDELISGTRVAPEALASTPVPGTSSAPERKTPAPTVAANPPTAPGASAAATPPDRPRSGALRPALRALGLAGLAAGSVGMLLALAAAAVAGLIYASPFLPGIEIGSVRGGLQIAVAGMLVGAGAVVGLAVLAALVGAGAAGSSFFVP